jgi:ribonucleoside-triphosphate reductase (formate)
LQDNLQTKYTGGTVLHLFLGEKVDDTTALKSLIKKVANNYRLPYFTISPTFSVCPTHGYLNGEQEKCSVCNQETEIYSRVVGYLRPVKQWNDGKQAEFGMRKTFNITQKSADEGTGTREDRMRTVIEDKPCTFEERAKEMAS